MGSAATSSTGRSVMRTVLSPTTVRISSTVLLRTDSARRRTAFTGDWSSWARTCGVAEPPPGRTTTMGDSRTTGSLRSIPVQVRRGCDKTLAGRAERSGSAGPDLPVQGCHGALVQLLGLLVGLADRGQAHPAVLGQRADHVEHHPHLA